MSAQIAFPFYRSGRVVRTRPPRRKRSGFSDLYRWYMHSAQWNEKREEAFRIRGDSCERCGIDGPGLHVHHVTYLRLGHEDVERDLRVLCEGCHDLVHRVSRWVDAG